MLTNYTENDVFKLVNNLYPTRGNKLDLICLQFKRALYKNSIFIHGPKLLNSLLLNKKAQVKTNNY